MLKITKSEPLLHMKPVMSSQTKTMCGLLFKSN